MKRIVHVCNDATFYLSHFSSIATQLRAEGSYVTVVASSNGKPVVERFKQQGVEYVDFPFDRSGTGIFRELVTLFRLFFILRNISPDSVHLFTIKPCIYGGIVSRALGVNFVIATITGLGYTFIENSLRGKVRRILLVFLYRLAFGSGRSCLVFENGDDLKLFSEYKISDPGKYQKIWGAGVDLNVFFPREERASSDEKLIMLPARMLKDKGVVEFCEAAEYLSKRLVSVRMVLVGGVDSDNKAALTESELLELTGRCGVEWWGHQTDMPRVLREADIVCLPSYREGMPKVLLEAMACGKPVVTTDVPGCREVLKHGNEGMIVKPKDSVSLALALESLIASSELCDSMGKAARSRAEKLYDVSDISRQYLSFYHGADKV